MLKRLTTHVPSKAGRNGAVILVDLGIAAFLPEEVAFWTGAGISFSAPTCGPGGIELVERALARFFEPRVLDRLQDYYAALELERKHPRLETVLDVVRRVEGLDALSELLSDLRDAAPNQLHRFFAAHLTLGGRHVTANFDTCVEDCGGIGVVHFHGSFVGGTDELGATLSRIQRGFPANIADQLYDAIAAKPVLAIVFAGYSGSDAFDVEPFLRRLPAGSLAGKTAIWLRHTAGEAAVSQASEPRVMRHFEALSRAGADCIEITGKPIEILGAFADAWGIATPTAGHPCPPLSARPSTVNSDTRRRASLELWAAMGLHREVTRLFEERPPQTLGELEIAAQTAWAQGRYREARRLWRRARPGTDEIECARRDERVGATMWVQGRLIHAYLNLRRALARARASGVDGEPRWLLAESLGRVLEHMQRRPLLRYFATEARRRYVLNQLPREATDGYLSRGLHLDARLGGIAASLGETLAEPTEVVASFAEAEALNAMCNYRHADLRRRANNIPRPRPEDYRRQRDQFVAIGAFGDAPRVSGIPGAGVAFDFAELRRDLKGVELARWPRILLAARFLRERTRPRLRATNSEQQNSTGDE